ncbi:UNVERIFIED_CONTAM: hypothetical protein Sindi_2462100 [Sesamum indicum]
MLSLVEKLTDLNGDLEKEMYIDVILQSFHPSFDLFMTIHELINMLDQYEATLGKFALSILDWETSTSRAKGKGAGSWKRKKDEGATAIASALSAAISPLGKDKENRMMVRQSRIANDIFINCQRAFEEGVS